MSTPYQLSLLRRTFAVLAAAAALAAISDAHAQGKVKLTGASGKDECAYSSMSITPDGSVTVQCSVTTGPPPVDPTVPGTFSMASAVMNATENTTAQVTVSRSGGGLAYTIYYWYTGTGCIWSSIGAASFATSATSASIPAPIGAAGSTCTVNLGTPPAPAALGTQTTTTITAVAGSTNPPPPLPGPIAGCPTGYVQPEKMLSVSLAGIGNPLLQMQASGQVVAIKLPSIPGRNGAQVIFGESAGGAYTPQPVTLEISINKCPGLIDSNTSSACNVHATNGNYNSITWLTQPYSVINSTNSNIYGLCWAGDGGDYYINARWTYQACAFGAQACGFAIQYNEGY